MFAPIYSGVPKPQARTLCLSLAVHLLFLGWILHSPKPIFVAPSEVARGASGSSLTRIYFGGETGVTQQRPAHHEFLRHAQVRPTHRLPPLAPKQQKGNATTASVVGDGAAAGSPYGSLAYGSTAGWEVRPALPVVSFDPVVPRDLLNGQVGDEIIEITIDSVGNIVETNVLQSLGPQVDNLVLAAVLKWHFIPASRNGVPIPSKQDVHYHLPR